MTTLQQVYLDLREALESIPGLGGRVWLQESDPAQETDSAGRVQPYVVLGLRAPRGIDDPNLVNLNTLDARNYRIQTQLVAPTYERLLAMTETVLVTLTEYPLSGGVLRPSPEDSPVDPIQDETVTPRRPFMPLYWSLNVQ